MLVAFCIVGHSRTILYDRVRKNLLDFFVNPFRAVATVDVFFLLQNYEDKGTSYPLKYDRFGYGSLKHPFSFAETLRRQFKPARVRILSTSDVPVLNRSECSRRSYVHQAFRENVAFYQQWWKVDLCYSWIETEEKQTGQSYDFLLKTRPDILILEPLEPKRVLRKREIVVPGSGMAGWGWPATHDCINDHIAVCPRHMCGSYFLQLPAFSDPARYCGAELVKPPYHVHQRIREANQSVRNMELLYTLMRPCPHGADCSRIHGRTCTRQSWHKNIPHSDQYMKVVSEGGGGAISACASVSAEICKEELRSWETFSDWSIDALSRSGVVAALEHGISNQGKPLCGGGDAFCEPLRAAAEIGHAKVVAFIIGRLKRQADTDRAGDFFGQRLPLQSAVANGHMPIIKLLVQERANVYAGGISDVARGASVRQGHAAVMNLIKDLQADHQCRD